MADKNLWGMITRTARKYYFNEPSDTQESAPLALNNEYLKAVNAAGTGVVSLLKANASDVVEFAAAPVLPGGSAPLGRVTTISTIATAAAVTYTAAQILGGIIHRDPAGAGRSDVLPTAALLNTAIVAAIGVMPAGYTIEVFIRNDADDAETITITAGVGGSVTGGGTMTIAQSNAKRFFIRMTSATAYVVYSQGTVVF